MRCPGTAAGASTKLLDSARWPKAAWGARGERYAIDRSMWPIEVTYRHLEGFLEHPLKPLSLRATLGYQDRARRCPYRLSKEFLAGVEQHLQRMKENA